jgi:2'-5' RNA ligase
MGIARFWSTNPAAAGHSAHRRENVKMRLFVAVWLPDEVIELISGIERPELPALRWTVRPQWHVTLRFLGEVDEVYLVSDALGLLAGSGTEHAVLGPSTAWFPGRRVLQLPVSGLENLSERVNRAISGLDLRRRSAKGTEERFRGHLTIARVRGRGRVDAAQAVRLAGTPVSAEWTVASLSLVSSSLKPDGPVYSEVSRVELTDSP